MNLKRIAVLAFIAGMAFSAFVLSAAYLYAVSEISAQNGVTQNTVNGTY